MTSGADLINENDIPLSLLTRALITSEQIGIALNEVDSAIRTTVNPVRIWLNRILTEILYFDTIQELSKTSRGLSILGVIIYIPRVIQDLYYIIQALVEDYESKGEFDLDAALLILQTRGFDALDAAIWAAILLLVLTGVTGLVVAPFIFFGYGFDLFESIFTHPKKIADLQKRIDEITQQIEAESSEERTKSIPDPDCSKPEKRSKSEILQERAKILSEQKELCEQHRNLNIGLSAGFVINAGVYLGLQTCLKFGLLVALSAVAPPLTIAVLSVAIIGSIASIAYYFCVKKPREEEFAKRLAELEAEQKALEAELKELEETEPAFGSGKSVSVSPKVEQQPAEQPENFESAPPNDFKLAPTLPPVTEGSPKKVRQGKIVQECGGQMHFKPSESSSSLVRPSLINIQSPPPPASDVEMSGGVSGGSLSPAEGSASPHCPPSISQAVMTNSL